MEELIAKRYAKALFDTLNPKELKSVTQQLESVAKSIKEQASDLVNSALISGSKKFEILIEPLKDQLDSRVYNLLCLMGQKNRLFMVGELVKILKLESKRRSNSYTGIVESDQKLSKEYIKKLEDILSSHSSTKISLKQKGKKEDGLKAVVDELGLELNFSRSKVKSDILAYIQQAL